MKKITAFLLVMALMLACCPVLPLQAKAENEGVYEYTVTDGEATITDCNERISGNVVIPATLGGYPVTSIGSYAFSSCTELTAVTIPEGVRNIQNGAFYYCIGMTEITLPDSLCEIEGDAFWDCTSLVYNTFENANYLGNSNNPYLALMSAADTDIITCAIAQDTQLIAGGAFFYCEGLLAVTIPDGVLSIGENAFYSCGLTTAIIPDSVQTIGRHAFYGCGSLTNVTIGTGLQVIGELAISDCRRLTGIWVNENNPCFSSDDRGVLFNKEKTELICAPGGLSGAYTIPDSVLTVGAAAFRYCSFLQEVTVGQNVQSIGDGAFYYNYGLIKVTIPDSVQSIGSEAFDGCEYLKEISLSENVTVIGTGAFSHCYNLTGIWVDEENPNYCSDDRGVLFDKEKTVLLQAPGGLSGAYTIPDTVQTIEQQVFYNCANMPAVVIPVSVTHIKESAFLECYNLSDVYYIGTEAQWAEISIGESNQYLLEANRHYEWEIPVVPDVVPGDLDGNENVDEDDAIYLLQYVLMPDLFPVEQAVDYDGNEEINEDDAIYLLQHVLMPDLFPL